MSGAPRFTGVFKSFDSIAGAVRDDGAVRKSAPASQPAFANVSRQFRNEGLAKRLRAEQFAAGFWGAMRDQRYDGAVVTALTKSGVTDANVAAFMASDKGTELAKRLHGPLVRLGLAAHVQRMYGQWSKPA